MTLTFDSSVAHRRIDADAWNDVYVVGDVHGCPDALDRLLDRIEPDREDLLVFVGDLVRKGPDSHAVLERVRRMDNAVSVLGNNEAKILRGEKHLPELTSADHAFVESMPTAISWADSLVVHGGVDHRRDLAEHTRRELLNYRSLAGDGGYDRPLWFETRRERPRVFFGHTPLSEPFATDFAVGLDTGCVYGGQLTAFDCARDRFVAVEPAETHEYRPPEKFVDPTPRIECHA